MCFMRSNEALVPCEMPGPGLVRCVYPSCPVVDLVLVARELPPEHQLPPPFQHNPAHHAHEGLGGGVPLLHQVFVHLGLAGG